VRNLTIEDVEYLAMGAAVLGTGGGGDPYLGKLMAKRAIMEKGEVSLIDVEEISDDCLVIPTALMDPNGLNGGTRCHARETPKRRRT